jgi:hypothetical protein
LEEEIVANTIVHQQVLEQQKSDPTLLIFLQEGTEEDSVSVSLIQKGPLGRAIPKRLHTQHLTVFPLSTASAHEVAAVTRLKMTASTTPLGYMMVGLSIFMTFPFLLVPQLGYRMVES